MTGTTTSELVIANITSPPVLAFVLGLLSVALRANIRLPEAVYQGLTMYLLLAIGVKGGVALRETPPGDVALPLVATVAVGIVIPVLAYVILRGITRLGPIDRGAMAAHYGSTSLVTFTAALAFLQAASIPYEGFVATLLTVMEIPGIVIGLALASRHTGRASSWAQSLHEVLTGRSVLLLAGGLAIGAITGPTGYERVEPFFGGLFTGALTLFLLEMGVIAGRRLPDVRTAGIGLVGFAMAFPVLSGSLGVLTGHVVGLSAGGAAVLGILCASASYIAAPAAVRLALPEANPAYTLTAALGLTFPFNLIVGIPLMTALATGLQGLGG